MLRALATWLVSAGCLAAAVQVHPDVAVAWPVTSGPKAANAASGSALDARTQRHRGPSPRQVALAAYNRMSVRERIGQLFVIGVATGGSSASERAALDAGAAGNVYLHTSDVGGVRSVRPVVRRMTSERTYAGVRPLVGANQEGGYGQRLTGAGFDQIPTALRQGSMSARHLQKEARRWGRQLRAAGLNLNLAPVADVVPARRASANQPIGRYDREYGHTPATAGPKVAAFVRGWRSAGVATTVKHFPGLGRATGNTDYDAGVTDPTGADDPYLRSFAAGIKAHTDLVMMSSALYPKIDRHHRALFSPRVIGLLRQQLGFRGIIVTDTLSATNLHDVPIARRATAFLRAGGTMMLDSDAEHLVPMELGVLDLVRQSPHFGRVVRDDILQVLEVKARMGLIG